MKNSTKPWLFSSRRFATTLRQSALNSFLLLLALLILIPMLYILAVSFTHPSVYTAGKMVIWPEKFTLGAYRYLLNSAGFFRGLSNSLFLTLVGTPLQLVVSALFAYALSFKQLPGRRIFMALMVIPMLFSVGLLPRFLLIRNLNLLNTYWAIILPGLVNFFAVMVLKSHFQSIPQDLTDAARIDGCSEWQIFTKVVLPLSQGPLAAFTLFMAVGLWNDYLNPVIYLQKPNLWPLTIMLQQAVMANGLRGLMDTTSRAYLTVDGYRIPDEVLRMATIVIVMFPIVVIYPFLQRYFAKGVMLGSVKE
jgi:putative aldouronate transport system permease protein